MKLYTHGAQERNSSALLEKGGLNDLFRMLGEVCGARGYRWCSVSAWQMRRAPWTRPRGVWTRRPYSEKHERI